MSDERSKSRAPDDGHFAIIESHGMYATSEGGVKERIRWVIAERVDGEKFLRELCSCGEYDNAERVLNLLERAAKQGSILRLEGVGNVESSKS